MAVGGEIRIVRQQHERLGERLCEQQAIERVAVTLDERRGGRDVPHAHGDGREAGFLGGGDDRHCIEGEPSGAAVQRDFPDRGGAEIDLGDGELGLHGFWQTLGCGQRPQQHLRVEQQPHDGASGCAASKSSGSFILPTSAPSLRGRGVSLSGTMRATGRPLRARMTSLPAKASSTSLPSVPLALCMMRRGSGTMRRVTRG